MVRVSFVVAFAAVATSLVACSGAWSGEVTLAIDTNADVHPISPWIYGVNEDGDVAAAGAGLLRMGGNRWTAYNWENNASNAGADYCFQNDNLLSASNSPGAAVTSRVTLAANAGAAALVTIPIVDYVAADKPLGQSGPPTCSGDVRNSANHLTTRFRQNQHTKGSAFTASPSTADGFVYQDEFVSFLKGAVGSATVLFSMDNEPDLWAITHEEVHPAQVGYVELLTRNVDYASAVKRVWPEALVTGFVSYGWSGYVNLQDAPDQAGPGDFVDYFLDGIHDAQATAGMRLVDVLDLHWYPEATGGGVRIIGTSTAPAVVEARLAAPRSLWDGSYVEDSWIPDTINGAAVNLIPRMKAKIAARDPGMALGFTEWNYGGGQHISGALATADVLGIFGVQEVKVANFWALNPDESFSMAAFKAYRNYDGAGARFGDTSVSATSIDPNAVSVYASVDSTNPDRVVAVAINKRSTEMVATVSFAGGPAFSSAAVYSVTSAAPAPVALPAVQPSSTNVFVITLAPTSISVIAPCP